MLPFASTQFADATDLIPARIVAFNAPDALIHPHVMQSLAHQTAHGARVGVLIGHNRFALHTLTRWARVNRCDAHALLTRIELSRAFTCYQLHRRIITLDVQTPRPWRALYVLGLLDTLYDESVEYAEAARLLNEILVRLKMLCQVGLPVLITLTAPKTPGREGLITLVADHVDDYWEWAGADSPHANIQQLALPWHRPPRIGEKDDGTHPTNLNPVDPGI